MSNTNK